MADYFATIIGAGPAGTAAAIQLATAGKKTLLVDKMDFPRDKICGDGLTSDALKLLTDLGVDVSSLPTYRQVDEISIYSPSGRVNQYPLLSRSNASSSDAAADFKTSMPLGAVVTRKELDMALLERAKSLGVETSLVTNFLGVTDFLDDGLEIETSAHKGLTTSFLIAADGMWSNVRKSLSALSALYQSSKSSKSSERYLGDWMACRQYYTNVSEKTQNGMNIWFEPDLLPGYFWSFPLAENLNNNGEKSRGANIGFGVLRSKQKFKSIAQKLEELMSRPHIKEIIGENAEPMESVRAWPIPANLGYLPLIGKRTFFTGDAAAATDPMTGEGVAQALGTGILAAQAAIENSKTGAEAAYEKSVYKEFSADLRLAKLLHRVLMTPMGARAAIRISGINPLMRRSFARWLISDYPRALAFTPARWKASLKPALIK